MTFLARGTIQTKLIRSFVLAILLPSLVAAIVGVLMIRHQVYVQAQARVNSDLEAAKEIYANSLTRLQDALRIHATRMVIYGALDRGDPSGLSTEMQRIRLVEGLDVLTVTDRLGRVFHRTQNPDAAGDDRSSDALVRGVLRGRASVAGSEIVPWPVLRKESPGLAEKARMDITPTPKARPSSETLMTSGMMLLAAAPVFTPDGRFLGVLYGGVLLNRNFDLVDKIQKVVFKDEAYGGQLVGTATIFQDDVRISTNVKNLDGTRAITTRVSALVAEEVLRAGRTWRGRAFVVNDWYISAYAPLQDLQGKTIGMLYVGTLERPYRHSLWKNLAVFLGITLVGLILGTGVAMAVARRISRPIQAIAAAASKIARGDYDHEVEVSSADEIGVLAGNFNWMVAELVEAHKELTEWGENLERKVEQRTAEVKAMQAHLLQAEKLAAVGKLAAGVAHEINNPLTGVLTNASLMLEDLPPDDARREDLQTIVDETLRCRKIVKGLLEFARQSQPQMQALDLNKVLEDVLGLVRNQASFRNITIQTDLFPYLPGVMADRDQMRQVFLNIVLNASDAMPKGGRLAITSVHDRQAGMVEVTISDDGPGIPEEIRGRLFEPFFTTKRTGTGLGLSIAYGIIDRHKGDLRVGGELGRGTTFTVSLPVAEASGHA